MAADCCYVCNECSSSFNSLTELEQHMVEHSETSRVEDQDMPQHSPSSSDSHSHDAEDDELMLKPGHHCRFCQTSFEDQQKLTDHYQLAHRDKPRYTCHVCHLIFGVKRELSTHMRIHSGEQPHKCTQCGKEFGTRQLLKKHWMWHTGERTHVCKTCDKAFFQKGHLTQHLMIHSQQRPHQCNLCQKTFIFKFDLNRHMKIHAERGYACSQCGRSFQRQSSLDEHQMKCKGRTKEVPQQNSFPATNPLLNLTSDHLNKMAQSVLAQQRAITALLNPPLPAPTPTQLFCVLCSQHFPNQQTFAIHMYSHVQGMQNKPMEELTLPIPQLNPIHPIKIEDLQLQAMNMLKTEDMSSNLSTSTTAISSAASSPQKPSPFSDISSSETTTDCFQSKHDCVDCERQRSKASDLERELREKAEQLQQYKDTMKAVVSTATQLLSQCGNENLFVVHTRDIFSKLHSTLLASE